MAGVKPYTHDDWKKTNADRIRAMTDEELAAYLSGDEAYERTHWTMIHWLDWLKEEVTANDS